MCQVLASVHVHDVRQGVCQDGHYSARDVRQGVHQDVRQSVYQVVCQVSDVRQSVHQDVQQDAYQVVYRVGALLYEDDLSGSCKCLVLCVT